MAHVSTIVPVHEAAAPVGPAMPGATKQDPQDPVVAWWNSLPTWNETSERVQDLTKNLPSWNETSDRVQEVSKTTVDSVRKSTAETLRVTADRMEDASKNTAAKMREAAPWVSGEQAPPQPLVRMEDLHKGDMVFRKAMPAEVVHVGHGALVVRMQDSNTEINTECHHVSLSVDASQHFLGLDVRVCIVGLQNRAELNGCHGSIIEFNAQAQRWSVKLDSTSEVIRANPRNLSALVAPSTSGGAAFQQCLEEGMRVRLEGLQNRPELNGCQGALVKFLTQEGRWHIKIDSTGEVIGIHPRNISVHGVTA